MVSRSGWLAAIGLAVLPLPAGAQTMPGVTGGGAATSPADRANVDAMERMGRDMPKQGSGDPDHDFVAMMTPHHQGAIAMAKVQLRYGKDPALRRLARSIIADQEREITTMARWQARHPR